VNIVYPWYITEKRAKPLENRMCFQTRRRLCTLNAIR